MAVTWIRSAVMGAGGNPSSITVPLMPAVPEAGAVNSSSAAGKSIPSEAVIGVVGDPV